MTPKKINYSVSRLVNPPGASLRLTEAQVWKGLEMKVREPQKFVAAISSCEIVSDIDAKVVRNISLGKAEPIEEIVEMYNGAIMYFESPADGRRITNILSYDQNDELVLTFSFVDLGLSLPSSIGLSGTDLNKAVGAAVDHTIAKVRELVRDKVLQ